MPWPARWFAYGHQPHCCAEPSSGTSTTPCGPVPTSLARVVAPLAVVSVSSVDGSPGCSHRVLNPAGAGPALATTGCAALGPPSHPAMRANNPTTSKYLMANMYADT